MTEDLEDPIWDSHIKESVSLALVERLRISVVSMESL